MMRLAKQKTIYHYYTTRYTTVLDQHKGLTLSIGHHDPALAENGMYGFLSLAPPLDKSEPTLPVG